MRQVKNCIEIKICVHLKFTSYKVLCVMSSPYCGLGELGVKHDDKLTNSWTGMMATNLVS